MFTIILKQAGFRRTFTPIIVQTREFKREVAPCDLDANHPDNPLNKDNEKKARTRLKTMILGIGCINPLIIINYLKAISCWFCYDSAGDNRSVFLFL